MDIVEAFLEPQVLHKIYKTISVRHHVLPYNFDSTCTYFLPKEKHYVVHRYVQLQVHQNRHNPAKFYIA